MKIRAYNTQTKEMYTPEMLEERNIFRSPKGYLVKIIPTTRLEINLEKLPLIVQMSTGHSDMNMDDVFVGDIVEDSFGIRYEVQLLNGMFQIIPLIPDVYQAQLLYMTDVNILGNIFLNTPSKGSEQHGA